MQARGGKRGVQRGVTMIEGCCVLAIAGIVASTAVPSFKAFGDKARFEGIVSELTGDLRLARSEAVARGQGVRVSFFSTGPEACYVVHTGPREDCGCGAGGTPHCTGAAQAIKAVVLDPSHSVQVAANVASMRFDPNNGTVQPAGTICATGADGRARHLVVNIMGRARACTPGQPGASCGAC